MLRERLQTLDDYERDWGLDIPITWRHPQGFTATVEAARAMADAYGVDYATPRGPAVEPLRGARCRSGGGRSSPASSPSAPDGARREFDLSAPEASETCPSAPSSFRWIETHFEVRKLRRDYPHWSTRLE